MVKRSGYIGVKEPERRFEGMRSAIGRLRALELAQARPSPAGAVLDHAVVSIRMAANLLTHQAEFFELQYRHDEGAYARTVAELEAMRPVLQELRAMAAAYHPATPEYRSLNHAADALRMAADVLSGKSDFYRIVSSDGSSGPMRWAAG